MIWGETRARRELVRVVGADPAIGAGAGVLRPAGGTRGSCGAVLAAVREGIMRRRGPQPRCDDGVLDAARAARRLAAALRSAGVPAAAGLRTGLRCAAAMPQAPGDAFGCARSRAAARGRERARRRVAGRARGQAAVAGRGAVADGRVVRDGDDAVAALGELGPRVAVKVSAADVQHKSELGGEFARLDRAIRCCDAFTDWLHWPTRTAAECWSRGSPPRGGAARRCPRGHGRAGAGDRTGRGLDRAARRCGDRAFAGDAGRIERRCGG